jgi:hypothetical protein
MEGKLGQDFLP